MHSICAHQRTTLRTVPVVLLTCWGLSILLLFNGCAEKKTDQTRISRPAEIAELVSHVTSGIVSSTDEVRVRFVEPQVKRDVVGHPLKNPVFSFNPSVDGIARWKDERTLVFRPNRPLPLRQEYRGTLDTATLLTQKDLLPLTLQFAVAGRAIASLSADFELQKENDPRYLAYCGTIVFTEETTLDAVATAAGLRAESEELDLSWEAAESGVEFTFTSSTIERGSAEQSFVLSIAKAGLDITRDYEKRVVLSPLREMSVQEVDIQESDEHPRITIAFSDDLDRRQDITGLVTAAPPLETRLKAADNKVIVSGEFRYGQSYTLTVHAGIRSRWGTVVQQAYSQEVAFEDLKPQIRFANDGVFLPSINQRRIRFMTLNLNKAKLEIKRVFDSNLGQFLQSQQLDSARDRRQRFNDRYVNRVGIGVVDTVLEIGAERNVWLQHELDLDSLIQPGEKGPFLISLSFEHEDMLYGSPEELEEARKNRRWFRGRDRHSHPYSWGYLYSHGRVYKPVILSDIGLTHKKAHERHLVHATDIGTTAPLSGVTVTLRTYQNQIVAQQVTDGEGKADFSNTAGDVFYVEAEKDGQRSVIKSNEMAWNLSAFDTGGEASAAAGIRAFIYTERGVYRPGDEINLSVIARNEGHTFPENHPVSLEVYTPRDQLVVEQTKRDGRDGFYSFSFKTDLEDPTGNWKARVLVGSRTFDHVLKIETVAPYRLKVNVEAEKQALTWKDETLSLDVLSTYLVGNPASGLEAEVEVKLRNAPKQFSKYSSFSFTDETVDYETRGTRVFKGPLDAEGKAHVDWQMPSLESAPSALEAIVIAKVFEKGGRPNRNVASIPVDPYPYYVGIDKPQFRYGYARVGTPVRTPIILVTPEGEAVAGRPLTCRIYRNTTHWWWEYDNRDAFRLRYKKDQNTELVGESTLFTKGVPVPLVFTPGDRGDYLIEVQDGDEAGHTAAFFIHANVWGEASAGGRDAGVLALRADKEKYTPGDRAVVSFPVPREGAVLVSVERGLRILHTRWYKLHEDQTELAVDIPITAEMTPTAYAAVSVLQPHHQTLNDRPIRMYGVVPLHVEEAGTRQDVQIVMPDELESRGPFEVEIQTADGQPTQFTVAVVDEGLLDLTRFRTPDPWKAFFRKLGLGVRTYDLFSHIIGVNKGDIFKTFSIGGGMAGAPSQPESERAKRFRAVSMFKGPLMTDEQGGARVSFDMPDYIGSVRVMAVAAHGNRYGHAEKAVPVKTDLMVLPTLPRVLGPGDTVTVPVTVFAMADSVGPVSVSIDLDGPLALLGEDRQTVVFGAAGEQDVQFQVRAEAAVGPAGVSIAATSEDVTTTHRTDLQVRPSSPRVYAFEEKEVLPGESVSFTVPDRGIPGSNHAQISLRRRPNLQFAHRLLWLIRYPYGCIEQVVSSVFPQLYLKEFLKERKSRRTEKEIDNNINAGISRLRKFQLPSGAFTYWPGNRDPSFWGTSYAGHFLVEARKLGYHVPQDVQANWLRHQKSQALTTRDDLTDRVYRVYLLALAGEPQIGPMNLLKEGSLQDMNNMEKWLLAGAYRLAGVEGTANEILRSTGMEVEDYTEFGGTYGSGLRDRAIILDMLVLFERWREADALAEELALALSSPDWHSTQTTGFTLLAMGKYLRALEDGTDETPVMMGTLSLPDGQTIDFNTEEISYQVEIESGFGRELEVRLDKNATVKRAFVTLDWDGVPLKSDLPDQSRNLTLEVEWLDEDGMPVDPTALAQGASFWGHIQVSNPTHAREIEELALVQMLPAGWEIENVRLSEEAPPGWMSQWQLNREEYLDIRDDRAMWFFDLAPNQAPLDFAVKLNAVTVGSFVLPPTTVEAMYDNRYKAITAGTDVKVLSR